MRSSPSSWPSRAGSSRGGTISLRRLPPFLVLALLLCGCGPTAREAGTAVLCAAPGALLGGLLLLAPLLWLWRRRYPELTLRKLPSVCLFVALANGAVARAVFDWPSTEWTVVALWWFGTSYAAVMLLVWRIWFRFDSRRSFTWASMPVLLVFVAPAVWLAFEGSASADPPEWIMSLWIWPGWFGYVPGGLLVILLIEAALRGRAPNPLAEERPRG